MTTLSTKTVETKEKETVPIQVICEETKPNICDHCRHDPCVWKEFVNENKRMLWSLRRDVESGVRSGKARKTVFQKVTRKMYGVMGSGRRIRLPQCVYNGVRKLFPSEDGQYMGFKPK